MRRWGTFTFGLVSYLLFLAVFAYGIAFVCNVPLAPKTIDFGGALDSPGWAAVVDTLLIALFGVHHSVAARPAFKRWIPRAVERNAFVLIASLLLGLLWWQWRPIPGTVWALSGASGWAIAGLGWGGWGFALLSSFAINHFDLFGLRQAWFALRGQTYQPVPFRMPALYRVVRHPLMLGLLIAFWATPSMTRGHVLFASLMSAYIVIGVAFEERDLLRAFGEAYACYRKDVPAVFPRPWR